MINDEININFYINKYLYNDDFEKETFLNKKFIAENTLIFYTIEILKKLNYKINNNENDLVKLLQILSKTLSKKDYKTFFNEYTECLLDISSYIQISQLINNINQNKLLTNSEKIKKIYDTKNNKINWDKKNNIRNLYDKNFYHDGTWGSISTSKNCNPAVITIMTFLTFKENFILNNYQNMEKKLNKKYYKTNYKTM